MSPKRGISLSDLRNPYGGRAKESAGDTQLSIPGVTASGASTVAVAIDEVRYFPFVVDHPIQVDQLTIEVTSAGSASTTARLGIYHADKNFQATTLVVDAGTVTVDSTGQKDLAVSPAEMLAPGRYMMAFNSDGTPTLRGVRAFGPWGLRDLITANPFIFGLRVTQTYAAFPDPGTQYTSTQSDNTGMAYLMFLRVAEL